MIKIAYQIWFVIELARGDLVEESHHDQRVENASVMTRRWVGARLVVSFGDVAELAGAIWICAAGDLLGHE